MLSNEPLNKGKCPKMNCKVEKDNVKNPREKKGRKVFIQKGRRI